MKPPAGVILALAALLAPAAVQAQAPAYLPIQGYLTDAEGEPVRGETQLEFFLYEDVMDVSPVFHEQQVVFVDDGFFTVYLGLVEDLPLSLFDDSAPRYLGMAVGDEPEMSPRLALGSVPYAGYAQHAGDAHTLQGQSAADFRPAAEPVSWADLTDLPPDLQDGDSDLLADLTCAQGQVAKYDAGAAGWSCADDQGLDQHAHDAADITSGVLDIARLPVGEGEGMVAAAEHQHPDYADLDHDHFGADIVAGVLAIDRLPVGEGPNSVAAGDHSHDGRYSMVDHMHTGADLQGVINAQLYDGVPRGFYIKTRVGAGVHDVDQEIVFADAAAGSVTLNIKKSGTTVDLETGEPIRGTGTEIMRIVKVDSSNNPVVLNPAVDDQIIGTSTLTTQWQTVELMSYVPDSDSPGYWISYDK